MEKDNLKLLITGVSGLLGNNLAHYFKDKYEVTGLYSSHPVVIRGVRTERCDLLHDISICKFISDFKPSLIIHCASLTNIDQCESDTKLTEELNVIATKNIVEAIADKDIKLVYISTDAVYDGIKGDFTEDDEINPLNFYGLSKYKGERYAFGKEHSLILRTNIFGWNIQDKKSLGEWILEELNGQRRISGFKDAYFSSIYTMELARVIDIAIKKNLSGIYNCGSPNSCSKYEFAIKLAECFGLDKTLIAPISIDDFNFKARRGKNLSLKVNKIQKGLDYKMPTIEQSIEAFYRDYKCHLPEMIKQKNHFNQKEKALIPYGRQWVDENDIVSVMNVLRSDRLTQGPRVDEFERSLTEYTGAKYAVAVNSGTAALHIACLAAEAKSDEEVITSPITFAASANCALYCGSKPVFADIDPRTYNIVPEEINKKINRQTKVVIPVHFAGQSCDMEAISKIVKEKESQLGKKIYIIEDACHALGSLYKNKKVGSCDYSDMVVMSFHPVKNITTGEGGVVLTNDEELYKRLRRFRNHGITNDSKEFMNLELAFHNSMLNPWYYEQIDLGFNYRITDIHSALGISQLKRIDSFIKRRREIVESYNEAFKDIDNLHRPFESPDSVSVFHLYVLLFDFDKIGKSRAAVMEELKKNGVGTQVHYIPVYRHPYYRRLGNYGNDCPNAEAYYKKALSIPLFPMMDAKQVLSVTDGIKRVINE